MRGIEPNARIREVAAQGVRNSQDVVKLMSALMADVVTGRVSPAAANKLSAETGRVLRGERKKAREG